MNDTKRITRIDTLTDEQRAAMATYAQTWIDRGLRTGPCTDAEWADVEAGLRDCYRFAGLQPPQRIVRVASPLIGAAAFSIASLIVSGQRGAVRGAVRG